MTTQTIIPLSSHKHMPVFCTHPIGGGNYYGDIAKSCDRSASLYYLDDPCLYEGFEYESMPELAEYHLENILEIQSKGPFRILGYCSGNVLAYEIAVQLEMQGHKVILDMLGENFLQKDDKKYYAFLRTYLEYKLEIDMQALPWNNYENQSIGEIALDIYQFIATQKDIEVNVVVGVRYIKAIYLFRHAEKHYQATPSRVNIAMHQRPNDFTVGRPDYVILGSFEFFELSDELVQDVDLIRPPLCDLLAERLIKRWSVGQ
jgi:hypothetical protein